MRALYSRHSIRFSPSGHDCAARANSLRAAAILMAALACVLCAAVASRVEAAASSAAGGTWETVQQAPLAGQRITALLTNGASGVWAGTEERGLVTWDGRAWGSLTSAGGLADNRIVALFADRQGHRWVSTGTGLGYLPASGGSFRRVPLKGLPSLPVLSIGQAADGAILLGCPTGLAVWRPDGALQLIPELAGKRVYAIRTARDGVTWIGTSVGLWRSAGLGWKRDEKVSAAVTALAEGPDGHLFLASDAGAWELGGGTWQLIRPARPAEFATAAVHDGTLWLGGRAGLTAGQGDVWQGYDPRLLPSPEITSLAWAGDGRLWIGTPTGLVIHTPDATAPRIGIALVAGLPVSTGPLALQVDDIDRITLEAGDTATPSAQLRLFVRLDGVDDAPRLLTPAEAAAPEGIAVYAGRRLSAGTHTLHAWAQDDAFNRSSEAQVVLQVPALTHLPGGLTVRNEILAAAAAGLGVLLAAWFAVRFARATRRRQLAYAAQAAAVRVRAASARSAELYAAPVPLRDAQVQDALAALPAQSILLLGEEGMGKTETLAGIAEGLAAAQQQAMFLLPAPVDLAAVAELDFFARLIAAAARALSPLAVGAHPRLNWSEGAAAPYGEQQFSADLGVLLAWLQSQRSERLVLIFLIDNAGMVDQYAGAVRDAFRRLVISASAAGSPIRLVLAADRTPGAVDDLRDLFHTIVLPPLAEAAAVQLLRRGAGGIVGWELEAARLVAEQAGGNPQGLMALGRAAALAALAGGRLVVSTEDTAAAHALAASIPAGANPTLRPSLNTA